MGRRLVTNECRFILGMMNGITPALRTTVHEVCGGSKHGVQAMAYIDGESTSFQPLRRLPVSNHDTISRKQWNARAFIQKNS